MTMSDLMLDVGQAQEIKLAARRAGATNEDLKVLSEGDMFAQILLVLRGRAEVVLKSILEFVRTVRVDAQPTVTTSKQYFEEAGVRWTGENFKDQFLGLEVSETGEIELVVRKLTEDSPDALILAELGDKAETPVSTFRAFLNANRGSSEWFIFYLKGKDGNLWAVYAFWFVEYVGWYVIAYSVSDPLWWFAGYRAVSRN